MPGLRSLLMPALSAWMLSPRRLDARRAATERRRVARGEPHRLLYFHQVDDPYSALAALALPPLLERYGLSLQAHVVGPPSDAAAPDRARLVAWSRRDAGLLARHHGLAWADPGAQPAPEAIAEATCRLVALAATDRFAAAAGALGQALWQVPGLQHGSGAADRLPPPVDADTAERHLGASARLRRRLGHYLGGMFHYGGEWYWGIDRLHHLERRLQSMGLGRTAQAQPLLFPPGTDWPAPVAVRHPQPIDFFLSLRSPYTAIAAPRVLALGRHAGVPVRLRYVLPMAMRGLPVPAEKRHYIALDAAREARHHGLPFGRINDPLGRPTERGLALLAAAERSGRGEALLLSFLSGVWAEGIDAGSDRGLRTIAERAGMGWAEAVAALRDERWRAVAEDNRSELLALGLWGVPTLRVGALAVWGQDRLWAVQDALQGEERARCKA